MVNTEIVWKGFRNKSWLSIHFLLSIDLWGGLLSADPGFVFAFSVIALDSGSLNIAAV